MLRRKKCEYAHKQTGSQHSRIEASWLHRSTDSAGPDELQSASAGRPKGGGVSKGDLLAGLAAAAGRRHRALPEEHKVGFLASLTVAAGWRQRALSAHKRGLSGRPHRGSWLVSWPSMSSMRLKSNSDCRRGSSVVLTQYNGWALGLCALELHAPQRKGGQPSEGGERVRPGRRARRSAMLAAFGCASQAAQLRFLRRYPARAASNTMRRWQEAGRSGRERAWEAHLQVVEGVDKGVLLGLGVKVVQQLHE